MRNNVMVLFYQLSIHLFIYFCQQGHLKSGALQTSLLKTQKAVLSQCLLEIMGSPLLTPLNTMEQPAK